MSGYFPSFPAQTFTFDGVRYTLEDLTRRVIYEPGFFNNDLMVEELLLTGERPDVLADILYNDSNLWWIPLIVNNITFNEWPIDDTDIIDFLSKRHTRWEMEQVLYYVNDKGERVPSVGWQEFVADEKNIKYHFNRGDDFNSPNPIGEVTGSRWTPVTLREDFERTNEARRRIYVIRREYVREFVMDFRKRLSADVNYSAL